MSLQDQIKDIILENGLRTGDALPAESELMRRLGVGRTAVREAIKGLQAIGIVEVRRGFGTFVGRVSLRGLVDGLTFHSRLTLNEDFQNLRELVDVREALETGLMPRVAARMTPDVLRQLDQIVQRMEERAIENHDAPDEDRRFHEVLYAPLGKNRLLIQLIGAFWTAFHNVSPDLEHAPHDHREVARSHRRIIDALGRADAAAATAAMAEHFVGIRERLQEAGMRLSA